MRLTPNLKEQNLGDWSGLSQTQITDRLQKGLHPTNGEKWDAQKIASSFIENVALKDGTQRNWTKKMKAGQEKRDF